MRKTCEIGVDLRMGISGSCKGNADFGKWRGLFGTGKADVFLRKRPFLVARAKREVVRGKGTLTRHDLGGDGRGDGQGRRMRSLSELIENGLGFWREDGLDNFHEGATFWAASRIATEGGFKELVPGNAHLLGKNLGLFEQGVSQGQKRAAETVGQETIITDDPEVEVRDMSDQTGDEIQNRKRKGRLFLGVMIEVLEGDLVSVVGQNPRFPQGRTFEVSAQIFEGGLAVVGLVVEVNHPVFSVKMVEPGIERAVITEVGELLRELQLAETVLLAKEVDDLITPHDFERFVVEKAFGEPALAILGETTDGGGQMEVKIAFEIAAEGVADLENTGGEALFARQFQDDVGGQGWDEIEEMTITPEEFPEMGGHGEGDVLPGGVRQNIEVGFDPFIGGLLPTRRAETRLASMGNGFGGAAGGTPLKVRAQQHGLAGHHFEHIDQDAVPELALVQGDESFPPIPKNHSQADFATDKFHADLNERKVSRRKEKVAAPAA